MGAPKQPRKKRPKAHPNSNATRGEKNNLWRLWNNPETRPQMLESVRKAATKAGRPPGVTDGMSKATVKRLPKIQAQAEKDAERILRAMEEEGMIPEVEPDVEDSLLDSPEAQAREAMKTAIVIMRMPGNKQTRLTAARTILEWTRAKPASTVNQNIAAEDFLGALLAKDKAKHK